MKPLFTTKILLALAMAMLAAAGAASQTPPAPIPTSLADSGMPNDIVPGSPLAEVLKLLQAGVDVSTIKSYILNAQSAFNLDADKILYLKDAGAPSDIINAMMDRDKVLYAATVAPPPSVTAPLAPPPAEDISTPSTPDMAPPAADVTLNYFDDALAPYGSWLDIEGYGQCWRPTVAIYDPRWMPYGDRGHWVYTDYGWYWDSDYAWGATFHYGRWFRSPQFGWCWYPDTVWAPSWVVWRCDDEYCGWAPLPPFAVFTPGGGFLYQGASVGPDFDFGLGADCFVFVSPDHFCDRHPSSFFVAPSLVTQVFRQTTVVNNYSVSHKTIVNRGIGAERIARVTHHPLEPVQVSSLPNAGRQGWRGEGFERTLPRTTIGNNNSGGATTSGRVRRASEMQGYIPGQAPSPARLFNAVAQPSRVGSVPERGIEPLPPRQFVPAEPPHPDVHPNNGEGQPPPAQGASQGEPQPRNSGSGSSAGSNNGSNNSNRQNH